MCADSLFFFFCFALFVSIVKNEVVCCLCVDVGVVLPKLKPSWICGQGIQGSVVQPDFRSVKVTLPLLPDSVSSKYDEFEIEWRRLGSESWKRTWASTSISTVTLPEDLVDGSYEVRVRATGDDGRSLHTTALRFQLLNEGRNSRLDF